MFKMFAIVVNVAAGQAQHMVDPQVYPTFEKCTAAIPAKYAAAKEVMNEQPPKVLFALGCGRFESPQLPKA
jgi:hypothetical protein